MIKRLTRLIILCMLLLVPAPGTARADGPASREYQLKAAFIYNFAQFVEWPASAFANPNAPFVIGVVGDSSLSATLEQAVKGKTAGKREIAIKSFSNVDSVQHCNILFVSASERDRMGDLIKRAANDSVLTIGDFDGFTAASGMVRFMTEDNKLRFEVNLDATNQGHLKFSAQLLKLARMYNK
jgi:hypothetical protein